VTATVTYKQANLFAAALDADDFEAALDLLAPDCVYERTKDVEISGAESIIQSYRESSNRAQQLFDSVLYTSDVMSSSETMAELLFADHLEAKGNSHIYRSRQYLQFDAKGAITRIRHEEISGERDRLNVFIEESGLKNE
jgi:hypothetical protein